MITTNSFSYFKSGRPSSAPYFGVSVLLHLGLLVYFGIAQVEKSKSILPIGVEFVVESVQRRAHSVVTSIAPALPEVRKSARSAPVVQKNENSGAPEAALERPHSVTAPLQKSGSLVSASLEGVQNGQEVSAEERFAYEIKKWFDRKKIYPQMAKAMGISGIVVIEFTLNAAGEVLQAEVKKGSHPSLDQSALQLVKSIHGQKPFPQEIKKSSWTMSVPIEFALR